ncbi:hypothetical protein EI77_02011 [Prosthecobacter fusiformis]|uniref:Uncharacterized protein n=2 Tax=Prosthecobacter fusiformis TaxID=48464 RepID=A0A4V3FFI3_9BACT|nr:hypothetical protein EI77_02011 [Prosthecobacter fusiformis]
MAEPEDISWLDQRVDKLARLEKSRTKRNNPLPLSAAHRRYVNAAGDVRLRLAYHLDPGDAILYEILHFHLSSRTQRSEASLKALSHRAMAYGLRQGGSLSDALTGAGAAINLLNDELRPENTQRDFQAIQHQRDILERSLARYGEIRSTAQSEGWWDGIPSVRRDELEEHAKLLTRIRDNVRRTQVKAPSGP